MDNEHAPGPSAGGAQKTIRVFVSSTFRDMHSERDLLNRIVFPELRSRCLKRGAELIGMDLRWGVTEEEAEQQGALAICLEEIEGCRPFFVCLLGDRFGWVPPPEEVPSAMFDEVRNRGLLPLEIGEWYRLDETAVAPVYRLRRDRKVPGDVAAALARFWESNHLATAGESITAREIRRALFEEGYPPSLAFFYLRKSGLQQHAAFPFSLVPVFLEQDASRAQKLAELKQRIRSHTGQSSVREYETGYAGLRIDPTFLPPDLSAEERETLKDGVIAPDEWPRLSAPVREAIQNRGTVALNRMEELGQQILDDLWPAIEAALGKPAEQLDAHRRERAYHERFVVDRTRLFLGRSDEMKKVAEYAGRAEDHRPLVITGEPGAGKSALMSECVRRCRDRYPEALVIPHFIGAAPGSASLPSTLRSLCETLRRELALGETVETDPLKLRAQLAAFLAKAEAKRPVVLFLDALNQLDPAGRSHDLDWLPVVLPPGTKLVVSTLAGDCLDQLERRVPADHVIGVPALLMDERQAMVEAYLDARRKKLTTEQLASLLDTRRRPAAGLPLYLRVALQELCLFGSHEALSERIDRLPEGLPELFDQVLARLEQDHGRPLVEPVCAWLAVARSGLLESEVLDLLGCGSTFPRILWTRLYRGVEPYLKPMEEDDATGNRSADRLDFYHDQIRSAAYRRYLHMASPDAEPTEAFRDRHCQLAEYFRSIAKHEALPEKWRTDRVRGLSELPFHLTQGQQWQDLASVLGDLGFIEAKCSSGMTYDLVDDYSRLGLSESAPGAPWRVPWLSGGHYVVCCPFCWAWSEIPNDRLGRDTPCRECSSTLKILSTPVDAPAPSSRTFRQTNQNYTSIRSPHHDELTEFALLVRRHSDLFASHPQLVYQTAANWVPDSGPHRSALRQWRDKTESRPWLRIRSHPSLLQPLTVFAGKSGSLRHLAFAPDGSRLVTAGGEDLTVWAVESGEVVHRVESHSRCEGLEFTTEGRMLLAGRSVIDTESLLPLTSLHCPEEFTGNRRKFEIAARSLSPDGRLVACCLQIEEDGVKEYWLEVTSLETMEIVARLPHAEKIKASTWSPDASVLMAGTISNLGWRKVRRSRPTTHTSFVEQEEFREIAAATAWDTTTWSPAAVLRCDQDLDVRALRFCPSGKMVAACCGTSVRVWDTRSWSLLARWSAGRWGLQGLLWSVDQQWIITWDVQAIQIWNAESWTRAGGLSDPSGGIESVACSPDGRYIAVAGIDSLVRAWPLAGVLSTRSRAASSSTPSSSPVKSLVWSPDSSQVVVTRESSELQCFDFDATQPETVQMSDALPYLLRWDQPSAIILLVKDRSFTFFKRLASRPLREIEKIDIPGKLQVRDSRANAVTNRLFVLCSRALLLCDLDTARNLVQCDLDGAAEAWDVSLSGQYLAASMIREVHCWRIDRGNPRMAWKRDYLLTRGAVIWPDGAFVASATETTPWQGSVKLFNIVDGREIASIAESMAPLPVTCSPDGTRLIVYHRFRKDPPCEIWDLRLRQRLGGLEGPVWGREAIPKLHYSSDGSLVFGYEDSWLWMWDGWTGDRVTALRVDGEITTAMLAGGGRLAGGTQGGQVLLAELVGRDPAAPIVTAIRPDTKSGGRNAGASVFLCVACGQVPMTPMSTLTAIAQMSQTPDGFSGGSPCLSLPSAAWNDPRLKAACPACNSALKFNPFFA